VFDQHRVDRGSSKNRRCTAALRLPRLWHLVGMGQDSTTARIQALDEGTLLLCIALLDHALYKDIYDSVIVSSLAALGIGKDGCFVEATIYTSHVSALIKVAQLLVIQRSVLAVERDEVDYAADILDVMQDRRRKRKEEIIELMATLTSHNEHQFPSYIRHSSGIYEFCSSILASPSRLNGLPVLARILP
jgi:hypothetical protein